MTTFLPLTTVQYRVDAVPFPDELDARCAIMEYKPGNPDDDYSIRHYPVEGWYVLVQFPNGGLRWLTRGTRRTCPAVR
jgi:hypothetical protein